jgi:hypothetical protein
MTAANYEFTPVTGILTVNRTTPTVTAGDTGGTYNGQPYTANGAAAGIGGVAVNGSIAFLYTDSAGHSSANAPTNAGTYTVVATFTSGDPNYSGGQSQPTSFTITPATPTVSAGDNGGTYNAQTYPVSGTATGVGGSAVNGTFTFSYADGSGNPLPSAPVNAGHYTVVASFTSTDPNYSSAQSQPTPFTISPATPTITATDNGGVYSGLAYPAGGTSAGITGQPIGGTFRFTYTDSSGNSSANAPVNAGSYTVVAAFASSDPNYAAAQSPPTPFTITPATPTVTAIDAGGVYNGEAFTASGTATGVGGVAVSGSFTFRYTDKNGNTSASAPVNAGSYTVVASFTSSDPNYGAAPTAPTPFAITPATPTVTATDVAGSYTTLVYPATGSATGVGGSAVSGTFTFSYADSNGNPLPGAPVNAGTYTVIAAFTSNDGNYTNAQSQPTPFTITPATPTVVAIDAGGPFTNAPYPANATVTGVSGVTVAGSFSFTYQDSHGTALPGAPTAVGTCSVVADFTSADPNYTNAGSTPVSFSITPGPSGLITTDIPIFAWTAVAGADHYSLKIIDGKTTVLTIGKVTATAYALTAAQALTPGHSYAWTVTPLTASGKALPPGGSLSFQVLPIGAPTPSAPAASIATDRPIFTWTAVADAGHTAANHFTLQIKDTGTKSTVTITNLTGSSYTLSAALALTPGHDYTWSVTAVSTNGKATVASGIAAFQVLPLGAPTPSSPIDSSATDRPTFAWTSGADAGHTTPDHCILTVTDKATRQAVTAKVTGTSYTLTMAQALTPGHTYLWSVTAVSTNGKVSLAGSIAPFSVSPLTAPTGLSFANASATFSWQPVPNAGHYTLVVQDSLTKTTVVSVPSVPSATYQLTAAQAKALKHSRSYTWYVTAVSTNGKVSVRSASVTFTI